MAACPLAADSRADALALAPPLAPPPSPLPPGRALKPRLVASAVTMATAVLVGLHPIVSYCWNWQRRFISQIEEEGVGKGGEEGRQKNGIIEITVEIWK